MTLKAKVDKLEDVDAAYHDLYEEKDGAFVLKPIEGMKPQAEFDVVHTALGKERTEHRSTKTKLATEIQRATELEGERDVLTQALEGKGDDSTTAKLIEQRVSQQTAPLARQVKDLEGKLATANTEIEGFRTRDVRTSLEKAISKAAAGAHVRDTAIEDAVLLGQSIFELVDGQVVTKADIAGVTPGVSPEVWFTGIKQAKPHWFKESAGGGAGGGNGGGGAGDNPWTKANWNLTKQGQVLRENPTRAAQLAKAAGSEVGAVKPPEK